MGVEPLSEPRVDAKAIDAVTPMLAIVYTHDPQRVGERATLYDGTVLGRLSYAFDGVPVDDPRMSRHHTAFYQIDKTVIVEDQDSLNGTYLNGRTIHRAEIYPGDVLQIGDTFVQYIEAQPRVQPTRDSPLVGYSPEMDAIRARLTEIVKGLDPVLLLGPPGVGKTAVAQEIHRLGRRTGAFAAVNARDGDLDLRVALSHAQGGTLLVEDIADLPPDAIAELLLLLGQEPPAEDAARLVVSATQHLAGTPLDETLREHLSRLPVTIPALRRRPLDIGGLLIELICRHGAPEVLAEPAFVWRLLAHPWPGNAAEFAQIVRLACEDAGEDGLLCVTERVAEHLAMSQASAEEADVEFQHGATHALPTSGVRPPPPSSRDELADVLRIYEGNIAQVAKHFGRHPSQVYRWLDRYGVPLSAINADQ